MSHTPLHMFIYRNIRINIHPHIYPYIYISVYVVMLYSAIFTQITRIIIYFDHFRYSKDKDVGMQMKPYIPSKEWCICFSSRKTNEYATDKKLRGSASIQPFFTHITRIIIYFDHFRYSKDKDVGMQMKPYIPSTEWYICFSSRKTNAYATDKKLRGECFHSAIFHAYYAYYYLF